VSQPQPTLLGTPFTTRGSFKLFFLIKVSLSIEPKNASRGSWEGSDAPRAKCSPQEALPPPFRCLHRRAGSSEAAQPARTEIPVLLPPPQPSRPAARPGGPASLPPATAPLLPGRRMRGAGAGPSPPPPVTSARRGADAGLEPGAQREVRAGEPHRSQAAEPRPPTTGIANQRPLFPPPHSWRPSNQ